jgi:hypothetical protein
LFLNIFWTFSGLFSELALGHFLNFV